MGRLVAHGCGRWRQESNMGFIDHDPLGTSAVSSELLWREHGLAALRLATVLVGPADAHDVAVAAFLRADASRDRVEIIEFRRYLLRAVRNEARSGFRSLRRRRRRDLTAVPARDAEDRRADVDVRAAICQLSERQRTVLFLAYWEDMTEATIAETLGLSRGTVHRDLERARVRLREALG